MSDTDLALAVMDDDGWGCAITTEPAPVTYVVIYRYGFTEVESVWGHDTREYAVREAEHAADEGADEAWIEVRS